MRFQANFLSLSRTLSILNKCFGPLKVQDPNREILLYSHDLLMTLSLVDPSNLVRSLSKTTQLITPSSSYFKSFITKEIAFSFSKNVIVTRPWYSEEKENVRGSGT